MSSYTNSLYNLALISFLVSNLSKFYLLKILCVRAIKWKHFVNGWVMWVGDPTLSQVFSKISVTVERVLDGWEVDAKCVDLLIGWGVDVRCDVN